MNDTAAPRTDALDVYLLGQVDFEELLSLQRRLVYEVSGDRRRAVLVLCEHDPLITVGRHGSRAHIHFDAAELSQRGWPVRWVNRGGGCLLHAPGQVAMYPIFPLDGMGLRLGEYINGLREVLLNVAGDACVHSATPTAAGIAVDGRPVAQIGVAVRDWVSYFGAALNIAPELEPFRRVRCAGYDAPMTSLERERRLAVNPVLVRQRMIERVAERFRLSQVSVYHDHPALPLPAPGNPLPPAEMFLMPHALLRLDAPEL